MAAEQHFGLVAVAVGAGHKQAGPDVLAGRQKLGRGVLAIELDDLGGDAAKGVIGRQLVCGRPMRLQFAAGQDAHALRRVHDVQRRGDGARGRQRAVPAHGHMLRECGVRVQLPRTDQHRAARPVEG